MNKIDKSSARLTKKKEKTQVTTKRNERRDIVTDLRERKRITKEYCEQVYYLMLLN